MPESNPEYTFILDAIRSYKNKLLSLLIKDNNGTDFVRLSIDLSAEWPENKCNIIAEDYSIGMWIFLYNVKDSYKINVYIKQTGKDQEDFKVIALPSDINNMILERYQQYHYSYEH